MGRDREGRNRGPGRVLLFILGLAGLGVGIWIFGKQRRKRSER